MWDALYYKYVEVEYFLSELFDSVNGFREENASSLICIYNNYYYLEK